MPELTPQASVSNTKAKIATEEGRAKAKSPFDEPTLFNGAKKGGYFMDEVDSLESESDVSHCFVRLRKDEQGGLVKEVVRVGEAGMVSVSHAVFPSLKDQIDAAGVVKDLEAAYAKVLGTSPKSAYHNRFVAKRAEDVFESAEQFFSYVSNPEVRKEISMSREAEMRIPDPSEFRFQ